LRGEGRGEDNAVVSVSGGLNLAELRRYMTRVSDRWPIEAAYVGGARVAEELDHPGSDLTGPERGPEFVVVLVSAAFDQVPWLERLHVAGSLWDGLEMGSGADIYCYTPPEFHRKQAQLPKVRDAVWRGVDLVAESQPHRSRR